MLISTSRVWLLILTCSVYVVLLFYVCSFFSIRAELAICCESTYGSLLFSRTYCLLHVVLVHGTTGSCLSVTIDKALFIRTAIAEP